MLCFFVELIVQIEVKMLLRPFVNQIEVSEMPLSLFVVQKKVFD
jgi:hypothetical protein